MIDYIWTLPGLQDDAFLINAWTLASFFYFCIFSHVASPPLFPLVFRVREGPDWVCFGDAQSLPSLWRSSRPSRWSVFLFRPEHGWPAVNRRWPTISRYPITTKGVNKAITLVQCDDWDDKAQTQDRVLFEARDTVLPFAGHEVIRLKNRLILYFTASCLFSVPDRSTRLHISYPFTGHRSTIMYMCANTPAFSPLVLFGTRLRPQVSPPSQCPSPRNRCDVIFRTLTFIIKWFMPCMPNIASPASDQRWWCLIRLPHTYFALHWARGTEPGVVRAYG